MFVSRKKYNDLITFCFREQARHQQTERMLEVRNSDVAFWQGQCAVYKARVDRLEQEAKARASNGQFSRVTSIF